MPGKMYTDYENFTVDLDDLVMLFKDGQNVITTIRELRGVVNDLISGGANSPLSAEQGVKLLDRIEDFLYQKAEGTATEIEIPMKILVDGYFKNFIAKYDNGSKSTTVNGALLYKPGTNTPPKIVASRAYTIRYSEADNCFFLEASATGNALESDVLAGKIFSTDNGVNLVGTLDLTNLISANIKSGITINGVSGKSSVVDTADATAIASQILSGITVYVKGTKITGTIPKKAAATITPGTTNQTIAAGQYIDGVQIIAGDANVITGNIKAGKSIFGVSGKASVVDTSDALATATQILSGASAYVNGNKITGTMPMFIGNPSTHVAGTNATGGVLSTGDANTNAYILPPAGYFDGATWVKYPQATLVSANIKSGVNILNVAGSLVVPNFESGTVTSSATSYINGHCGVDISGFNFTPKFALLIDPTNTQEKLSTVMQSDHFIVFPGNVSGIYVATGSNSIIANGRLVMPANQSSHYYNYYIIG